MCTLPTDIAVNGLRHLFGRAFHSKNQCRRKMAYRNGPASLRACLQQATLVVLAALEGILIAQVHLNASDMVSESPESVFAQWP